MGDFNAHHRVWGAARIHAKGTTLLRWAAEHDLLLYNDPNEPTRRQTVEGGEWTSVLDLIWSSEEFEHWEGQGREWTTSDHCVIVGGP